MEIDRLLARALVALETQYAAVVVAEREGLPLRTDRLPWSS